MISFNNVLDKNIHYFQFDSRVYLEYDVKRRLRVGEYIAKNARCLLKLDVALLENKLKKFLYFL